jgi:hypothetical protein
MQSYRVFPDDLFVGNGPFRIGLQWMIKPRVFDPLTDWE